MVNRAEVIDRNFVALCRELAAASGLPASRPPDAPLADDPSLTGRVLLEMFESQITSRHLDIIAREPLDRAPGPLDLLRHGVVKPFEANAHSLRVFSVRVGGRPHEVGEEHRRELPLLQRRRGGHI